MRLRDRRAACKPEVNIIPMIDIMFFLLVFFMMSTFLFLLFQPQFFKLFKTYIYMHRCIFNDSISLTWGLVMFF